MLNSNYVHNIDAKSRVFVPARFRLDLGAHFYVCFWEVDGCLRAYSEDEWKLLNEKLDKLTVKTVNVARKILGESAEAEMDSQGRILLPEKLRGKAGITDQVRFVGMNRWVELWEPDEYERVISQDDGLSLADVLSSLQI